MKSDLTPVAKHLRQNMTDAERRLWYRLRAGRLAGAKFRRQRPIGKFVVDFVCLDAKLVVEIDGSQHMDKTAARDMERTRWLEGKGFRVLRFWNNDVLIDTDAVFERILQTLTPGPSPASGRGEAFNPDPSTTGRGERGEGRNK